MRGKMYEKYLIRSVSKNIVFRRNQSEEEKEIGKQMEKIYGISLSDIVKTETWHDYDKAFTSKVFCDSGDTS